MSEDKKKILIKVLKKRKIIILFILLYFFGLFFIKDVNANFDEVLEQKILLRNVIEYTELIKFDRATNYLKTKKEITPISEDSEKDHGIATYYFFSPILKLNSPRVISILWHIYTYSIFFLGAICLFKLVNYLFIDEKVSIIITLLYYISPRILIDSFNNNKDIIFMSILIMMIYFATKFIKEKKIKDGTLFALIAGFVCNVKILGIFFFGIFGLLYIFDLLVKKEFNKENFKKGFYVATFGLFLYIFLTPAIWGSGKFDIINFIKYSLDNSTNFRGQISVLFEGKMWGGDNPPIPWYYLPKLMLMTIPIIVSILFITSLILFIKNIIIKIITKEKYEIVDLILIGTLICFIVPFMICVLKHPDIYNGWRHFYFLYGLLFIFVPYSLNKISKKEKINNIFSSLIIITLIVNVFTICKYTVRNVAYYNILAGRENLAGYYELDYYNTSGKDALNKFLENKNLDYNPDNKIYLYGVGFNHRIITDILTSYPSYMNKIEYVDEDNLKKYLKKDHTVYEISNVVYGDLKYFKKEKIYSYKIFNSDIINFYEIQGEKR